MFGNERVWLMMIILKNSSDLNRNRFKHVLVGFLWLKMNILTFWFVARANFFNLTALIKKVYFMFSCNCYRYEETGLMWWTKVNNSVYKIWTVTIEFLEVILVAGITDAQKNGRDWMMDRTAFQKRVLNHRVISDAQNQRLSHRRTVG